MIARISRTGTRTDEAREPSGTPLSTVLEERADLEATNRLVHGSVIAAAFLLGELGPRRYRKLRWVALGGAGWLVASAFTGWTPLAALLRGFGFRTRSELEHELHAIGRAEAEACDASACSEESIDAGARPASYEEPSHGVPHRIPEEVASRHDPDDKPGLSPDGDLGSVD